MLILREKEKSFGELLNLVSEVHRGKNALTISDIKQQTNKNLSKKR